MRDGETADHRLFAFLTERFHRPDSNARQTLAQSRMDALGGRKGPRMPQPKRPLESGIGLFVGGIVTVMLTAILSSYDLATT